MNKVENTACDEASETEEESYEVKFDPPVSKQRYRAVLDVAKSHNVKSVVDFGCAECKMLIMYKNILTLEQLVGVDIDKDLLISHR